MSKGKTDTGRSYWRCYDPELPVNIMVIGKTFCEPDYFVERKNSSISAFEYIESGSGFLQVNNKNTYRPNGLRSFFLKAAVTDIIRIKLTDGKSGGLCLIPIY